MRAGWGAGEWGRVGGREWGGTGSPPAPTRLGWAGLGCACERRRGGVSEGLSVSPQGGSACTKDPVLGCGLRVTACACQCLCSCWRDSGTVGGRVSRYIHTGGEWAGLNSEGAPPLPRN